MVFSSKQPLSLRVSGSATGTYGDSLQCLSKERNLEVTGIKFIKFTCKMVRTVFALTFKRFHQHRNLSHQL